MTEKELMLSEQLYIACDEELAKDNATSRKLTRLINTATEEQAEYRKQLFRELFQTIGENFWIEPPFRCDYGCHISIGENFYANFDCIMLDVCDIVIGDNVFFGPRVCVYTAGHPIDAEIRNMQLEYGKKVSIGSNVWVGGNTVINPGVSIGNNVVIGSGSVVTKDIPDNVIAVGNPCRILREITQKDKRYWEEQAEQYKKNKGR
ncbi:MAG: sugar O-acetyltransferase [Lachnospiraceae bacterium]|nr:sugar O-acetyltransferase [Lachnospiraceae bacterium]MDE7307306.1 sugar O-acetyltransferase [Lachnospiraceae bacterium]